MSQLGIHSFESLPFLLESSSSFIANKTRRRDFLSLMTEKLNVSGQSSSVIMDLMASWDTSEASAKVSVRGQLRQCLHFLGRIHCRIYWCSLHTVHEWSSGSQWRSGLCRRSTFDRVALVSPTSRHCAVTQDESGRRLRFALRHGPLPASGKPLRQLGELGGSGGYFGWREGWRKKETLMLHDVGWFCAQTETARSACLQETADRSSSEQGKTALTFQRIRSSLT